MGIWQTIRGFFSADEPSEPSAADVMRDLKAERAGDPEWDRLRNRLATLVLSEGDQQRVWRRAHRGSEEAARLLSGIRMPTADERERLRELVDSLERGR